jgi:hypothetical protein
MKGKLKIKLEPQNITDNIYEKYTPGENKLEIINGEFLSKRERENLLQLLLYNMGLKEAVKFLPKDLLEKALHESKKEISSSEVIFNTEFIKVDWLEIKSEETLNNLQVNNMGYIIITDVGNPNRIHKPLCNIIKIENFRKKVVLNKNKNGHYFWVDNIDFAKTKWKVHFCSKCFL